MAIHIDPTSPLPSPRAALSNDGVASRGLSDEPMRQPSHRYVDETRQPQPMSWLDEKRVLAERPNQAEPDPRWAVEAAEQEAARQANNEACALLQQQTQAALEQHGPRVRRLQDEEQILRSRIGRLRVDLANHELSIDQAAARAAAGNGTARDDMLIARKAIEQLMAELLPAERRAAWLSAKLSDPDFRERARQNDVAHELAARDFRGSVDRQKQQIEQLLAQAFVAFDELDQLVNAQNNAFAPIRECDRELGIETPNLQLDTSPGLHAGHGRVRFLKETLERVLREHRFKFDLDLWR